MSKDQREIARKLRILQHAEETGHVAKTCRHFGVGCSRFGGESKRCNGSSQLVQPNVFSRPILRSTILSILNDI